MGGWKDIRKELAKGEYGGEKGRRKLKAADKKEKAERLA
jgi:hypothetical protein